MGVRLPAEYQEVEWIQTVRDQSYLDIPLGRISFPYFKCVLCNPTQDSWTGLRFSDSNSNFYLIVDRLNAASPYFSFSANGQPAVTSNQSVYFPSIVEYRPLDGLLVNNISVGNMALSDKYATQLLLGKHGANIRQTRLWYCKLYDANQIILDLVPCYRKSDSEPGMYDLVTKQFFTNQGTGEFLVGPDVIDSISPLMVAWRRIMMAAASVAKKLVKLVATSTTGLVSFDTNVEMPTKVTCEFSPVQEGTGDPSPDNVRPISGWTGAVITRARKNLVDLNESNITRISSAFPSDFVCENGEYSGTVPAGRDYAIAGYNILLRPGTYSISFDYVNGSGNTAWKGVLLVPATASSWYASDKMQTVLASASGHISKTITLTENHKLVLSLNCFGTLSSSAKNIISNLQIEVGTTESAYVDASDITTLPINWQTEAGTIYGGKVTLNEDGSADLVETYFGEVFDGSADEAWSRYTSSSASAYAMRLVPDHAVLFVDKPDFKASYLMAIANSATWGNYDAFISRFNYDIITGIKTITSLEDWRNYLSQNPLQIVYPLNTPITYHFDNIGQLNSFLGTNNIWHNMNGDITVEYWNKQ